MAAPVKRSLDFVTDTLVSGRRFHQVIVTGLSHSNLYNESTVANCISETVGMKRPQRRALASQGVAIGTRATRPREVFQMRHLANAANYRRRPQFNAAWFGFRAGW
jgi:hypothetical protein